jgi:hypothetical protein
MLLFIFYKLLTKTLLIMNKQKLAIVIVAGLGILATFFPWVFISIHGSVSKIIQSGGMHGSVSGIESGGWKTLILFAIPLILCLLKDKQTPLKDGTLYGAIIPSIIALAVGIWEIIEILDDGSSKLLSVDVSIGFGLYMVVLAGIAIPIIALLLKGKNTA